jgi:hypothetical protein
MERWQLQVYRAQQTAAAFQFETSSFEQLKEKMAPFISDGRPVAGIILRVIGPGAATNRSWDLRDMGATPTLAVIALHRSAQST